MPKVKIPRKSTSIDMTAMCDVAFLLLTFFMLTTKFKPDEAVVVDTPSSISEVKLPETDIIQILIDKQGRVFFGIDGQGTRAATLDMMAQKYGVTFTPEERAKFSLVENFGVPVQQLKQFLALSPTERQKVAVPGIPIDSTNNQLGFWIQYARMNNRKFRVAIKGDKQSKYPVVKRVFDVIQERQLNDFYFITSLEDNPNKVKLSSAAK
ncbi:MAG: biopolymer transporter ExbD [Chitinophagales bacterium]|nr:biopolymer transporter ExbD [Chitinophagales bacterium]